MSQLKQLFQSTNQTDYFTKQAAIAALYVALTLLFTPMSFGVIQFRVSELLMLFILIDKRYIVGLTFGVFVANLFSPLGVIDLLFGTSATFIGLLIYVIFATERIAIQRFIIFIIALTAANAILVGFELSYLKFVDDFITGAYLIGFSEVILMIVAVAIYIMFSNILNRLIIK